uniref:Uncharacterized protein n=1 Tax=viral metagenome TaxID=1070528 RepID=A0A6M3XN73_9ZZZZ
MTITLTFYQFLVILAFVIIFIGFGYAMGRNSAGQPFTPKRFNPGKGTEPEGDLFNDAMSDSPEARERIKTFDEEGM